MYGEPSNRLVKSLFCVQPNVCAHIVQVSSNMCACVMCTCGCVVVHNILASGILYTIYVVMHDICTRGYSKYSIAHTLLHNMRSHYG